MSVSNLFKFGTDIYYSLIKKKTMLEIDIVSDSLTANEAAYLCVVLARIFNGPVIKLNNAAMWN